MSDTGKVKKFKDIDQGTWFIFESTKAVLPITYIKISDRRYTNAHEYEPRIKLGKNPRKSTIRQVGSINTEVIVLAKGWN